MSDHLLEALKLAEREMSAMRAAFGAGLLTDKAIEAARAAIAKAEGPASKDRQQAKE